MFEFEVSNPTSLVTTSEKACFDASMYLFKGIEVRTEETMSVLKTLLVRVPTRPCSMSMAPHTVEPSPQAVPKAFFKAEMVKLVPV